MKTIIDKLNDYHDGLMRFDKAKVDMGLEKINCEKTNSFEANLNEN
jgi:hypothetical protein